MSELEQNLSVILEIDDDEDEGLENPPVVTGETETIEPEVLEGELIVAEQHHVVPVDVNRDLEYDYEYTRQLHRDLIEQGQEALPDLLKVAKESQHPRAYEVASTFLKNLSDMADKLMTLQEKKQTIVQKANGGNNNNGGGGGSSQTVNIDKAVFTGSTADLLKQIRNDG